MSAEIRSFPTGLSVKELKDLLHNWPEADPNGEPTMVWVSTRANALDMVTSVTSTSLTPLDAAVKSADLHLGIG